MSDDYCAFVPVVNRPDLLRAVVAAVRPLWRNLIIVDNSPDCWVNESDYPEVEVYTPPVPFLFSQTMNWEMEEAARRGKTFCIHMHSDAVIPEGACEALLTYARNIHNTHPKWGVIYTLYDVLAVYNPLVLKDIGGYDTNFPAYFSDNDWYRRLELAGWERFNSGVNIGHHGSQTINSDPYLRHVNSVTFPLYRSYYQQKWGGLPGEETYNHPFGVRPREWKLGVTT